MKRISYWLCALLFSVVAVVTIQSAHAVPSTKIENAPQIAQQAKEADFAQHFEDLGVEGSILIYDQNQEETYQYNPQRNAMPFLPASTFKILNSLIALETGVIADDIAVFTWDGIERVVPAWNRDLNMRAAFNLSAVWFYQVIARRVGHERMQQWVTEAGYGNQMIGSPEKIDTFWLDGDLRTTPEEQIQFLRRLHENALPFSESAISTVKDIMIVEKTPSYTIRAKSGWVGFGEPDQEQIGWYVGYVEQNDNVYFFATSIDIRDDDDHKAREPLTRLSLETLGLL